MILVHFIFVPTAQLSFFVIACIAWDRRRREYGTEICISHVSALVMALSNNVPVRRLLGDVRAEKNRCAWKSMHCCMCKVGCHFLYLSRFYSPQFLWCSLMSWFRIYYQKSKTRKSWRSRAFKISMSINFGSSVTLRDVQSLGWVSYLMKVKCCLLG